MSRLLLRTLAVLTVLALLIVPLAVFAHSAVNAGNYTIEYGWATEPPLAGQANTLVINIGPKLGDTTGSISVTSPADDSTVQGDKVDVTIQVVGLTAAEANMHWHLKVDEQTLSMSPISKTTVTVSGLSNGEHTIEAILATEDHSELGKPNHAKITVESSSANGGAMVMDAGTMTMGGGNEELTVDVSAFKVEMVYASETTALTLKPVEGGEPGQYTADFTPTRAGLYTLKMSGKLSGSLGESEVSVEVTPEEVTPSAEATAAPLISPAPAAATDTTLWYIVGGVVVLVVIAAGAFFMLRKK